MENKLENERAWYIVQTYSGCENAARINILRRAESMDMQDYVFQALVPEVKSYETKKNGQLKEVITKPFPGYVFIDMIVTDESWFMIRNTPMVTGFLGSSGGGAKPVPLSAEEMVPILKICGMELEEEFGFDIGDKVRIVAGAFNGQVGTVDDIDKSKRTVRVLIDFFGRSTPAEVSFEEIENL